jgi:hypothetical protein
MSSLTRSRFIRWTALTLVLTLTVGIAGAAPARPAAGSRPAPVAPAGESLLAIVRDWVSSLFVRPASPAPPAGSSSVPAKAGCGMDPDGKPLPCK